MIGDFGSSLRHTNFKNTIPLLPANVTILRKGEEKAKPNPLEDLSEEGKKLLESIQKVRDEELLESLFACREKHLKNKGISFDQFKKTVQSKSFFEPSELVETGLIDDIGYAEDMMKTVGEDKGEFTMFIPRPIFSKLDSGLTEKVKISHLLTNRFKAC